MNILSKHVWNLLEIHLQWWHAEFEFMSNGISSISSPASARAWPDGAKAAAWQKSCVFPSPPILNNLLLETTPEQPPYLPIEHAKGSLDQGDLGDLGNFWRKTFLRIWNSLRSSRNNHQNGVLPEKNNPQWLCMNSMNSKSVHSCKFLCTSRFATFFFIWSQCSIGDITWLVFLYQFLKSSL